MGLSLPSERSKPSHHTAKPCNRPSKHEQPTHAPARRRSAVPALHIVCYPSHAPRFYRRGPLSPQGHEELRAVLPRRDVLPADRGVLIVSYAAHKKKAYSFFLLQVRRAQPAAGRGGLDTDARKRLGHHCAAAPRARTPCATLQPAARWCLAQSAG
jgi:hypothetical protein